MKNWLYTLFIFLSFSALGQEIDQKYKHLLTRGKVVYISLIEDRYYTAANIGVEYRFAPRHSFGVDFVLSQLKKSTNKI